MNLLLHLYHFRNKYNYILANINSESSRVIFSVFFFFFFFFVFIQWVKHFSTPANFVAIRSTVLNHNKKNIYIQLMFLVCQNCTLTFSRIRKQNWIIICQCCLRIEVLKYFVREGQNFFYLLCVCVWGLGVGVGGQVQYLSFREKITDPPPINK